MKAPIEPTPLRVVVVVIAPAEVNRNPPPDIAWGKWREKRKPMMGQERRADGQMRTRR